jgi:hypothetical protein
LFIFIAVILYGKKIPSLQKQGVTKMNMSKEYDFASALAMAKYENDKTRIQAIMLKSEGWECWAIAEELGCHEDSVSKWWSMY